MFSLKRFALSFVFLFLAGTVQASISTSGNVEPSDPSTWTSETDCYIGHTADGSMTTYDPIVSRLSYIAYDAGTVGYARVHGSEYSEDFNGSWTNDSLYVGYGGNGSLDIAGPVNSVNGVIGSLAGSQGTVNVSQSWSTWNCDNLVVGDYGTGNLNITYRGLGCK